MKQLVEYNAKVDHGFAGGNRIFILEIRGDKQSYRFKFTADEVKKLEGALEGYRRDYPKE